MLNKLVPLTKKRKTVGRGGSRGGTSGRGGKGQTARTGGQSKVRIVFEGGQTPLVRRIPKRGFNNADFKTTYQALNVGLLNESFEDGSIITKELLIQRGFVGQKQAVKLLGHGECTKKFTVHVDAASRAALDLIKKQGGEVLISKEK